MTQPLSTAQVSKALACPAEAPPITTALVCPRCAHQVHLRGEAYCCEGCEAEYPQHAGIPDLRVFDDPYLSREDDRQRTNIVLAALDDHNLQSLLEHYWSYSDITPVALRAKYIQSVARGRQRAARLVKAIESGVFRQAQMPRRVLEIGSGAGGFLAAASTEFAEVVGIDIAMRWLHLSRRRFLDEQLAAPPLVCCCAEKLPFPDASFDLVVATAVLEFVHDPGQVLAECARVLSPEGTMIVSAVNRYSLSPEPHVGLWGVGFLPRRAQARYVRWRRAASYEHVRLLSYGELRRLARRHFPRQTFVNQDLDDRSLAHLSWTMRSLIRTYRLANRLPLVSWLLRRCGPGWEAMFQKPHTEGVS